MNAHESHRLGFLRRLKSPLVVALMALAVAVIAAAAAIAAWLNPGGSPSFSSQQSSQAKKNVCAAYATVRTAVSEKTPNPRPDDPVAKISAGTRRQLVLLASSVHLQEALTAEAAAPADLVNAVSSIANTLEHLSINNLAGAAKDAQTQLWRTYTSQVTHINKLCG